MNFELAIHLKGGLNQDVKKTDFASVFLLFSLSWWLWLE
ncbi:hypothetical protein SFK1770_5249 [Shigella flexneri K-1770]|nr:hypothetical protein SFVA6_4960 [Shigella flexneri VA-6]EIQ02761.1 hypothetical protein SFK1770_5249 [Shigella flexneri K-1770]